MTPTLDTHHEGQQQKAAIVRPMANSLPSFKPDLKKKHKLNTDSIMKASGPLKATIPVKKVAPMLKTSPPTPDTVHTGDFQNNSQTKRIPTTPMAAGRSSVNGGVAAGYPNACSTPSITTPMKRSAVGGLPKPRYSYLSATPNAKTVPTATNATSALKRRTISEFKAKSPLKPRLSSTGSAAASSSVRSNSTSRLSTSTRLSTSSSARLTSKSTTATKLGANTATVRPVSSKTSFIEV